VEYDNELHQSATYARRLNITLVHALSVEVTFDSHFIIIEFVVIEKFALLCGDTLVG